MDYLAPEFDAAALVTIDAQADFLDDQPLAIPGTSDAVPKIAALASAFREAGRPIVHIVRLYRPDGSNVDLCRRADIEEGMEMLLPGTAGSQIAPGIVADDRFGLDPEGLLDGKTQEVADREVAIYKPRWGAFYGTPLEEHLRGQDVTTLVFCGWNFPNCPRTSIYEASERDFRIVVAADATTGLYDRGRDELEAIGVRVMESAEIVAALAPVRI